jgi:probable rRNA maturation factor
MELRIFREAKTRLPGKRMQALFDLVIGREAQESWCADINLVVTSDQKIRVLNRKYRGQDKPTDVLSFNIDKPSQRGGTFGEIYISAQTAKRQAESNHVSLIDEYLRLFCHGLLHLFGYDHKKSTGRAKMSKLEESLLADL